MPNPSRIPWREFPLQAWFDEGIRYLHEALAIDDEKYRSIVKARILRSIPLPYWQALVREANGLAIESKKNENIQRAIARGLGMAAVQGDRWLDKGICPDPPAFFGTLVIVLKKEIDEVGFPSLQDAIWLAASRTVCLIRKEDCRRTWTKEMSREEFACVWWLIRHPHSIIFLGQKTLSSKLDVCMDIFHQVLREFPNGSIQGAADVTKAYIEWMRPYLLFLVGLPKGWEFFDANIAGEL